jgi:alanine racemase
MRPSWIEVDLDAIRSNVATIREVVAPALVCAVVKADGYGHGDVPVAEAALAGGAGWLAVAMVEEGCRLREAGIEAPILLLSEPPEGDAADVVRWGMIPTVYRRSFGEAIAGAVHGDAPYPIHVKVDTGMHRVGTDPSAALEVAQYTADDPRLRLDGVWTHFAVAESDPEFTAQQGKQLTKFAADLAERGIDPPIVHAANTAAALGAPATRFDMVRVGLGVYGLRPDPDPAPEIPLLPAMRVVSQVALLRRLEAGARPSYGRRRPLPRAATVATVPIGYADGVARRLSQVGGEVLIGGRRRPYAGTVTMDQIVVDVGDDPVSVGDEVVLIGRQGDEVITADEWARLLDTINYEIVCDFSPRLPRRYRGGR